MRTALMVLSAVVVACHPTAPDYGRALYSIAVVGTVTDGAGAPISGAQVVVTILDARSGTATAGACTGSLYVQPSAMASNAAGEFGALISIRHVLAVGFDACLTAEVSPPTGSPLAPATQSKTGLTFKPSGAVADTARFVFQLAPR